MKFLHTTAQRRKLVTRISTATPYVFTLIVYLATYAAALNTNSLTAEKPERTWVIVLSGIWTLVLFVVSILITINWIGTLVYWVRDLRIKNRIERWIDAGADTYE